MPKDIYVYSTSTAGVDYTMWELNPGGVPVKAGVVRINGGANLADKNLVTPQGVVTKISEDEYEMLKKNHVFQIHLKNGFLKVSSAKSDANKVAATDMEGRDGSAPLVPQDYELGADQDRAKPVDLQTEVKASKKVGGRK